MKACSCFEIWTKKDETPLMKGFHWMRFKLRPPIIEVQWSPVVAFHRQFENVRFALALNAGHIEQRSMNTLNKSRFEIQTLNWSKSCSNETLKASLNGASEIRRNSLRFVDAVFTYLKAFKHKRELSQRLFSRDSLAGRRRKSRPASLYSHMARCGNGGRV